MATEARTAALRLGATENLPPLCAATAASAGPDSGYGDGPALVEKSRVIRGSSSSARVPSRASLQLCSPSLSTYAGRKRFAPLRARIGGERAGSLAVTETPCCIVATAGRFSRELAYLASDSARRGGVNRAGVPGEQAHVDIGGPR